MQEFFAKMNGIFVVHSTPENSANTKKTKTNKHARQGGGVWGNKPTSEHRRLRLLLTLTRVYV